MVTQAWAYKFRVVGERLLLREAVIRVLERLVHQGAILICVRG
jgi:hypothetical protein